MRLVLYAIWVLIPVSMILLALWSKLEQVGSKPHKKHARQVAELVKQTVFVSICVAVCFGIDLFVLEDFIIPLMPEFIGPTLLRIILLPFVFYIGALMTGGSKPESIKKAPRVSGNRLGKK